MSNNTRPQYHFQDALLIIIALCLVMCFYHENFPYATWEGYAQISALVMVFATFGAWLGIRSSERSELQGIRRSLNVAAHILILLTAAYVITPPMRDRMFTNEKALRRFCKQFAVAEATYYRMDYANNGVHRYAESLKDLSVVDPWMINAADDDRGARTFCGYYCKLLKGQGPNADGGQKDYVVDGKMVGGCALLAYPSKFNVTGRYTFVINRDGAIYQRDLGEKTSLIAEAMTQFDPDSTWSPAQ